MIFLVFIDSVKLWELLSKLFRHPLSRINNIPKPKNGIEEIGLRQNIAITPPCHINVKSTV
jgi:hypothetical protein